jgi:hypothetical protein
LNIINRDISFQKKQLKVRPLYANPIYWRIIGMNYIKREIKELHKK